MANYLSDAESKELIRRLPDKEAEEMLMKGNDSLIFWYLAKKLGAKGAEFEDYVSVGRIGLLKAIRTFDADREIKFITYASKCINNEMLMYFRVNKKHMKNVPFNAPIRVKNDEDGLSLEQMLFDPTEDVEEKALEAVAPDSEIVKFALTLIPEKERIVLEYLHGLNGRKRSNQNEIADIIGVSKSWVSRVAIRAHRKLRELYESGEIYEKMAVARKEDNSSKIPKKKQADSLPETDNLVKLPKITVEEAKDRIFDIIFNSGKSRKEARKTEEQETKVSISNKSYEEVSEQENIPIFELKEDDGKGDHVTANISKEKSYEGGSIMTTSFDGMKEGFTFTYQDGKKRDKYALLRKMLREIPSNQDVKAGVKDSPHYILNELVNGLSDETSKKLIELRYFSKLKFKDVAEKMKSYSQSVTNKDMVTIRTLHSAFIKACPEYAKYISQHPDFDKKSKAKNTSGGRLTDAIKHITEDIANFLTLRHVQNKDVPEISEMIGISKDILYELETVTDMMLMLQREYWLSMLLDVVNGNSSVTEDNMGYLLKFISELSKEDMEALNLDARKLMIFSALSHKIT